jgi:hypothetical protein
MIFRPLYIGMATQATWIFDGVPPSGTRRGGNPSEHAFEHDLDTFVREVLQNSNDVIDTAPVEVDFAFFELQGDELSEFMDVLDWDQLKAHLGAAAEGEGEAISNSSWTNWTNAADCGCWSLRTETPRASRGPRPARVRISLPFAKTRCTVTRKTRARAGHTVSGNRSTGVFPVSQRSYSIRYFRRSKHTNLRG